MKVFAQHKNASMAPRKLRRIRQAIIGLPVSDAQAQLRFLSGKASDIVLKVLQSAVANAAHNHDIPADKLTVSDLIINGAFTLKRFDPVSRGMAHPLIKRNSHVTVVVADGTSKEIATRKKLEIETIDITEAQRRDPKPDNTDDTAKKAKTTNSLTIKPASALEDSYKKMKPSQHSGDQVKGHRRKSLGG